MVCAASHWRVLVNSIVRQPTGSGKIRVGIVGLGHWSEYGHLPALKLLPEYELTAEYSRSAEKAATLSRAMASDTRPPRCRNWYRTRKSIS
jgi:predicted dehydrogenase